jgi:HK97 family phage major capsid protein
MAAPINTLKQARIDAQKALNALLDEQATAKSVLADAYAAGASGKEVEGVPALEAKAKAIDGQISASRKHVTVIDEQIHAEQQRLEDLKASMSTHISTHDNREDRPWAKGLAGLGEWAMSCLRAAAGHGADPRLFRATATGMGGEDPATGGYAVPVEQATEIEAAMFQNGQILSLVDARDIVGDRMVYTILRSETSRANGYRYGGVQGYWIDAGEEPTASSIKSARLELTLRKLGALGYMTDELVQDAAALGGELQAAFADELIFMVEDAIWEGNGAGQPLGILNAACWSAIAIETGQTLAGNPIVPQNLSKMWARIPPRLKAGAVWCVSSEMMVALDALALPVGTAALEPRFVSYDQNGIMRVKGRPVIEVEYASALGTVGDIVVANFKQYRLIRKAGGVQQASSIHVKFASDQTTYRAFYRVDGQPVPRGTVAEFKGSNVRTPFAGLAARS